MEELISRVIPLNLLINFKDPQDLRGQVLIQSISGNPITIGDKGQLPFFGFGQIQSLGSETR